MPDDRGKVGWIFADKLSEDTCRAATCQAPIVWAKFVKSGRSCPFDRVDAIRNGRDDASGRPTILVNLEASHYATCPEAAKFSKRGEKPTAGVRKDRDVEQARKECEAALFSLRSIYRTVDPVPGDDGIASAAAALKRAIVALGGQVREPRRAAAS